MLITTDQRIIRKNRFFTSCFIFIFTIFSFFYPVFPVLAFEDPQVISGTATVEHPDANTTNITASDQAILEYHSFDIGQNQIVNFFQPSSDSFVLNRVIGNSPTEIFGALTANGNLTLVNLAGILFAPTAMVNVGGLIASTHDISNEHFLNGNYVFGNMDHTVQENFKEVTNQGLIETREGGFAVLVGSAVSNEGSIKAPLGTVSLAAGDVVTVGVSSGGQISVGIDKETSHQVLDAEGNPISDQIKQSGRIEAQGGTVSLNAQAAAGLFDRAINQEGIIRADKAVAGKDGVIELISNETGAIQSTGELQSDILYEKGASFHVGGTYAPGHAYVQNADNAVTLDTGNYTGTTSDVADITVNTNAVITLTGNTVFDADSDDSGAGTFSMNSGSSIVGGNKNLTIYTSGNSTLRTITNVAALTLDRSASSAPTYTANNAVTSLTGLTINNADVTFDINGQDLGFDSSTAVSNVGTFTLIGSETFTNVLNLDTDSGTVLYKGDNDGAVDTYTVKDFGSGTVDYYNVTFSASDAVDIFQLGAAMDANGSITLSTCNLDVSTSNYGINVAGYFVGNSTFTSRSGTLTFDGDGTLQLFSSTGSYNAISVASGAYIALTTDLTVTSSVTNAGTFLLNGQNWTMTGATFSNTASGTLQLVGSETITGLTNDIDSGAWLYLGDGDSAADTYTIKDFGSTDYFNLQVWSTDGTTDIFQLGAASVVAGTFDLTAGTFKQSTSTLNAAGNVTLSSGTTFTKSSNSSAFTLDGSLTLTDSNTTKQDLGAVVIGGSSKTTTLGSAVKMSALTINSGNTFALAGNNFSFASSAAVSNSGTFKLRGSETLTNVSNLDTDSGTVEYIGDGDSAADTFTLIDFGGTDYYDLKINTTDSNDTIQSGAAKAVAGALTLSSGTYDANGNTTTFTGLATLSGGTYSASTATQTFDGGLTVSGGTYTGGSGTTDVNGAVTLSSGTLTAPSGTFTVSGNWAQTGGTFTPGTNRVTFDGSGTQTFNSGGTSFANITHSGSGTLQLATNNLTTTTDFTNSAGTFDLNGLNWTMTGATFSNDGTVKLKGSETVTGLTQDTNSGTFAYAGDGDGAADTFTILDPGSTDYYNLTINSTDSNDTFQSGAAKSIAGAFNVTAGTYNANGNTTTATGLATVNGGTYSASTATQTFDGGLTISSGTFTGSSGTNDVNGALTLSGGTFTAPSGTLTVSGNFAVSGSPTFTHNSGTVTFDGNSDQTFTTNGITLYNLTLNNSGASGSDDFIISGALDVNNTFTLTDGDFDISTNDPNVNLAGDMSVGANGTIDNSAYSGTWTFDGSSTSTLTDNTAAGTNFKAVTIDGSSKTIQLAGSSSGQTFTTLTIGTDDTFSLNSENVTISTLVNNGTFKLQGGETVTLTTQDTDSGTWLYAGDGDGAADTFTILDPGSTDYYNLTINSTDSNDTFQSGAAKSIAGAFNVTAGTYNANGNTTTATGLATVNGGTYSASTATQTFDGGLTISSGTFTGSSGTNDVNGALTLSGGTLTAPSGTLTVSGNFSHSGGTFTHNSGTVTLDGGDQTISGSTTFNNLTKTVSAAQTLTFAASTTQTIAGTLTLKGSSGNVLSLRSDASGTQWRIDPQGTTRNVEYLDVKDSYNANATSLQCVLGCVDSLNNFAWLFSLPSTAEPEDTVSLAELNESLISLNFFPPSIENFIFVPMGEGLGMMASPLFFVSGVSADSFQGVSMGADLPEEVTSEFFQGASASTPIAAWLEDNASKGVNFSARPGSPASSETSEIGSESFNGVQGAALAASESQTDSADGEGEGRESKEKKK